MTLKEIVRGVYVFLITGIVFGIAVKVYRTSEFLELQFLAWICILLLLFFVLLMTLFLSEQWRQHLLLVGISVTFSIYLVEAMLVWWMPFDSLFDAPTWWVAKEEGRSFDKRSKIEVVIDEQRAGRNTFPSVVPDQVRGALLNKGQRIVPLGGIANQRVVTCNESGEWVFTNTDEHGFNNPTGSFESTPIDALLIGDSYAFGECVQQSDTIAGNLRAKNIKAVSLGYGGVGPLYELAVLSEYGPMLHPRHVFWLYFDRNDPLDLQEETADKNSFLKRYYTDGYTQHLVDRQDEIDIVLRRYVRNVIRDETTMLEATIESRKELEVWLINHFKWLHRYENSRPMRFVKLWRLRSVIFGQDLVRTYIEDRQPKVGENLKTTLLMAKRRVTGWGGKLIFVYLSDRARHLKWRSDNWRQRKTVLSMAEDLQLPIIDIAGIWEQHNDPMPFFAHGRGSHYTKEGYLFVANQMVQAINGFKN